MQNAIINVNGNLFGPSGLEDLLPGTEGKPEKRARISVFDRGYLYGDSIYEVVRTHEGKFLYLEEHLKRFQKSADLCRMKLSQSLQEYEQEMNRTLQAFQKASGNRPEACEAYARLIVSRGIGKIGFGLACLLSPTQYTIIVQPLELLGRNQFEKGLKLKISTRIRNDSRALDPAMKSGNYLNSLLAYLEAEESGFSDAILCNAEGFVTEGTTFNVFYVKRDILVTSPLDLGILDGITRRKVMEAAHRLGVPVREVRFPVDRLYAADEVFLTSTIKEVFPITQIDDKKIGSGNPGPLTRKLLDEYRSAL